ARHHPLPAAAELHRAGSGARDGGRPHPEVRRQGAGAGAREERLCRVHEGRLREALGTDDERRRSGGASMTVAAPKTKAEQALTRNFEAVAAKLPGGRAVADARKAAIGAFAA